MLTRMVVKMLLKLTMSIGLMVAVMSYGMYLRGGDPGALFAKIGGGAFESAKSSVQGAGNSIKSVAPVAASKTKVYKWVDANGVTQFGSTPPDGVLAESKTYNNNSNVMTAQKPIPVAQTENTDGQPGFGPDGERLPGVAGMNFPTGGDPAEMKAFLQALQESQ